MGIGTLEDEIFRQSDELFSDLFARYRHSLKGTQCRRVGRYGPNRFQLTRARREMLTLLELFAGFDQSS
jgi:hypothetical protein